MSFYKNCKFVVSDDFRKHFCNSTYARPFLRKKFRGIRNEFQVYAEKNTCKGVSYVDVRDFVFINVFFYSPV